MGSAGKTCMCGWMPGQEEGRCGQERLRGVKNAQCGWMCKSKCLKSQTGNLGNYSGGRELSRLGIICPSNLLLILSLLECCQVFFRKNLNVDLDGKYIEFENWQLIHFFLILFKSNYICYLHLQILSSTDKS